MRLPLHAALLLTSFCVLVFANTQQPPEDNTTTAAQPPAFTLQPFQAQYRSTIHYLWMSFDAQANQQLSQLPNGLWRLTFTASATGASLKERSEFSVNDGLITPIRYQKKTGGLLPNDDFDLRFDAQHKTLVDKHSDQDLSQLWQQKPKENTDEEAEETSKESNAEANVKTSAEASTLTAKENEAALQKQNDTEGAEQIAVNPEQQTPDRPEHQPAPAVEASSAEASVVDHSDSVTETAEPPITYYAHLHDNLTYIVQASMDIAKGLNELSYTIVIDGRIREYQFALQGPETIDTPMGRIDTLRFDRINDKKDRQISAWFAPSLNYQLVRLSEVKNGKVTYRIELNHFQHP